MSKAIFNELKDLVTEGSNPNTAGIDLAGTEEILRLINAEDKLIVPSVESEIPYIAQAVDILVEAFKAGGRLIYAGAGTSGRLGVLDASECPPTYGTDSEMVQGIIAGGKTALWQSMEGAEDHPEDGARDLAKLDITPKDVVCGIAASRRTPYVLGALNYAREQGAKTLFVTCNPRSALPVEVDVAMCPVVGPEVVLGSTRMKAGTATKLVLNMLTTASMIRLGKVYHNMMVDLRMTARKLEERSKRVLMLATGLDYDAASLRLKDAGGHVKTALVMELADVDAEQASIRLKAADGFVRKAIERT